MEPRALLPRQVLGILQENQAVRRPWKLKQLFCDNESDEENREAVSGKQPSRAVTRIQPAKRILNEETGKNVRTKRPLMSMDTDLCPTKADSEGKEEKEEDKAIEEASSCDSAVPVKKTSRAVVKLKKGPVTRRQSQRVGEIRTQVTYVDTWYVIRPTSPDPAERRQQRQHLEMPLVKLANATTHMKMPSTNWTSKVTLYMVAPIVLQRHTMTFYTGDLKVHKIPERDRHKYQPSCVIFRRELPPAERSKSHMPYDRAIIFKHKQFTVNLDGRLVILTGAPDTISCVQDVNKLIDILEHITLNHTMVEIILPK